MHLEDPLVDSVAVDSTSMLDPLQLAAHRFLAAEKWALMTRSLSRGVIDARTSVGKSPDMLIRTIQVQREVFRRRRSFP